MFPDFLELGHIDIETSNSSIFHREDEQDKWSQDLCYGLVTFLTLWDERDTSIRY